MTRDQRHRFPPTSSSVVPPNVCLIHGSFVGSACPTCSTGGNIPTQQTVKP